MENAAFYYPCISGTLRVKVNDHDEVNGSHDMGASSSETRHFIDRHYLESIEPTLLETLVDPIPPCRILNGTKQEDGQEDRVVGMLNPNKRLHVAVFFNGQWLGYKLQNVLVIDSLPVPIHVSFKTIERPNQWSIEYKRDWKMDFPERYRSHAYWNNESIMYIGDVGTHGPDVYQERKEKLRQSTVGRPSAGYKDKVCAACGKKATGGSCARCHQVSYCSKECQRAHWKVHKPDCKP